MLTSKELAMTPSEGSMLGQVAQVHKYILPDDNSEIVTVTLVDSYGDAYLFVTRPEWAIPSLEALQTAEQAVAIVTSYRYQGMIVAKRITAFVDLEPKPELAEPLAAPWVWPPVPMGC